MSPAKTTAKTTYTANLVRSSMVPQTMARETAQKATWKRNLAESGTCVHESPAYTSLTCPPEPRGTSPACRSSALPVPKAIANPNSPEQQGGDRQIDQDLRDHATDVLHPREADLEHREPCLHEQTPGTAATITHTVSIASESSAVEGPFWAKASPGNASTSNRTAVDNNASLRKSFLLIRVCTVWNIV